MKEENEDKNKDKNKDKIDEKNDDKNEEKNKDKKNNNKENNDDEERPLKRTRRNSVVAENDTQIKPVCPGCFPIFQENQLGHYGPNGCLGDEFTLDDMSK
jgi:hypothetical protein